MNGRSALKIGIRDLFSNNRAAEKKTVESHCIFSSFEESHYYNWIQSHLIFEEIKAS